MEHLFLKRNLGPLMDYNNIHDVNNFVVLTVFDVAMTMIHLSSLTDESCIWLFEKKHRTLQANYLEQFVCNSCITFQIELG